MSSMNKKILALMAVMAASSMAFAACGSDKQPETTAAPSESVTAEPTPAETAPAETAAETEEDILPDETADLEPLPADSTGADNPLMPVIDKVTAESEWPALMEITDTTMLKEYFLLDPENSNYKQLLVVQCPMSAIMSEIILIEAEDVSAAEADLAARREKAISQDAWYPNDVEMAESSIVGTVGNYAYYIIGENAAAAEKSVNAYFG